MKSFDLPSAPLEGTSLIEASAGTGKTYTLTGLFLRLIVEMGLRVDQVVVVTFTNAATAELKERIRRGLLEAKAAFSTDDTGDERIIALMQSVADPELALRRIQDALIDFDRAAIFTIHGFCQRILQRFAFETGTTFQPELVQDATGLVQETADDFWRRYISTGPDELTTYAMKCLGGPEGLADTLAFHRYPHIRIIPQEAKPVLSTIKPWRQAAAAICGQWPQVRKDIQSLLEDKGLNARYYGKIDNNNSKGEPSPRQIRIADMCHAMDQWDGRYPLFERIQRFTASYLRRATKKGFETPNHPFFDSCEEVLQLQTDMERQLERYLRYLKVRLLHEAKESLSHKKAQHDILFFDDLLRYVHRALSGEHGSRLIQSVRSVYRAALLDEFQDTDPLQYRIFNALFARPPHLLAMIGDPKQAIYGFRGADLHAYLQAAGHADDRSTLSRNWRSTPGLVQAVNTVFECHRRPFGLKDIEFEGARAALDETDDASPPMRLWYLDPDDFGRAGRPVSQAEAVQAICHAVAGEVVDLIGTSDKRFLPEDIAILTRSHHQAYEMKAALEACHVPAVLHSAGRVYDTPEAEDLIRVLSAAAMPNDPGRVRAALCTEWLNADAAVLDRQSENDRLEWHKRWAFFHTYRRLWSRHGFYRMFQRLLAQEGVKTRLLGSVDGERRMTNILHLAELLHQAETVHRLGPESLVKWLASNCRAAGLGDQEQQLRLESDARAVRVITMHKSKGLQFNVVFCPFAWGGVASDDQAAVFHDPDQADTLTLALGPGIDQRHKAQAQKEALAENLRLLYVALTRARRRCYWVWGRISGTELSAPAYLLHAGPTMTEGDDSSASLQQRMAGMTRTDFLSDLERLARRSNGTIDIAPLPSGSDIAYIPDQQATGSLPQCRSLKRRIETDWRIVSFSSLTSDPDRSHSAPTWDDRDAQSIIKSSDDTEIGKSRTLFSFPKGIQAGLFFHDLLEHWHPGEMDNRQCKALVSGKLGTYRLDAQWAGVVEQMLDNLGRLQLTGMHGPFTLYQVPVSRRINEMEFYYRLQPIDVRQIQDVFDRFAVRGLKDTISPAWKHLWFDPVQGFLKGYIDVLFEYQSRYYLVDWKSNYLGPQLADYAQQPLAAAMAKAYYFLQYHLYVLALDQWLRHRLPGYSYAEHFGGVFYIFLRGVSSQHRAPNGVYYDRPAPELVEALNRLLIAA
jgi:exodeoxyribonuclease V beta subunit